MTSSSISHHYLSHVELPKPIQFKHTIPAKKEHYDSLLIFIKKYASDATYFTIDGDINGERSFVCAFNPNKQIKQGITVYSSKSNIGEYFINQGFMSNCDGNGVIQCYNVSQKSKL